MAMSVSTRPETKQHNDDHNSDSVTFIRVQAAEPRHTTATGANGTTNFGYVERFWLPLIGPTSLLLLRRIHRGFEDHPRGFRSSRRFLAKSLGIGAGLGQSAPLQRSLNRLDTFGLVKKLDDNVFEVPAHIPFVEPFRVDKLPPRLRNEHEDWVGQQGSNLTATAS